MENKETLEIISLKKRAADLQALISTFPEGTLHISGNGKYVKYYRYLGSTGDGTYHRVYISKSEHQLAVLLWEKGYLTAILEDTLVRIDNLSRFIDGTSAYVTPSILKMFAGKRSSDLAAEGLAHLATLDGAEFISQLDPKSLMAWQNDTYAKNQKYPDQLIISGPYDMKFRSKSEAFIASSLAKYQIPFRYECRFGSHEVYPDFTIKRPLDGQIIIWEHFGLWQRGGYRSDALKKLDLYARDGYVPGRNLIITCETDELPFSYDEAERNVRQYLV